MMHRKRRWCVGPAASPEDLARKLTGRTWTLCTGFFVEGHPEYLFLNDSTCEDAVQEYAALKRPAASGQPLLQVESITFGWCDERKALQFIQEILAGDYDAASFAHPVSPKLQTIEEHGICHLCA